jgi:rRNA maturation endonuclease Nob1
MKRQDLVCEYCDSECTVETTNMEDPIVFCPICGSEVDYEESEYEDWDEQNEEGWN